ncbi:hypothetical protein Dimus_034267 [Dionaea muscipula]
MDDDDEFGDLYTDVLTPFSSSISSFHQQSLSSSTVLAPHPITCPIRIKLQSDDDGGLFTNSNSEISSFDQGDKQSPVAEDQRQDSNNLQCGTSVPDSKADGEFEDRMESGKDVIAEISKSSEVGLAPADAVSRVLESGDVKSGGGDEDGFRLDIGAANEVGISDDGEFGGKEVNFGIEDDDNGIIGDFGEDPIIPGLGSSGLSQGILEKSGGDVRKNENLMTNDSVGRGDEWDSDDSEDDLHIVLNDNNHGPMARERNGMLGSDGDEDEDGEPLVIVSDTDAVHQPAEEQEWGEDAGQAADGERKEITEAVKANGSAAVIPKVGYSNYGYHPYHSQFKYVRPGAAPLPSAPPAALGGAPGQVRPPTSVGAVAGRGRGDWHPTGVKAAAPTQKGFQPGFWASNMSGRSLGGGLEFTLPSHKTIFEVDIDVFEEKPWKYPGIDLSDFFNFGLNEETWKEYCKKLEQIRLESKMQCRIHVYESGRREQEYDPELPPELAAAAGHDPPAENANAHKTDAGQAGLEKGVAYVPPPIPIGKAIQVEVGYGERFPSADTRPPRYRESDDAIIVILPQASKNGDSTAVDVASEQQDHDDSKGDHQKVDVTQKDNPRLENNCSDENIMKTSPAANSLLDDIPEAERVSSSPSQTPTDYLDGSRGGTPANSGENIRSSSGDRQTKVGAEDRSRTSSGDGGGLDGKSSDELQDESTESIRRKHISDPISPASPKGRGAFEDVNASDDEHVPDDGKLRRKIVDDDVSKDKNKLLSNSTRNQKLSSRVGPPVMEEADDGGGNLKGSRSSENSKATESNRDHQKWSDEEVIQDGRSIYPPGDVKRTKHEDGRGALRTKDRAERNYSLAKGRDDPYTLRDWDPYAAAQHFHAKTEGLDRRKDRDYAPPEGTLHRWDDDPHGRKIRAAEEPKKHERADEVPRHRGKMRETAERSEKDELRHSKKVIETGSWRGYDKDVGLRYRDGADDLRSNKRRIDDNIHMRRDHIEKEENLLLLAHRESSSRRKRERGDEQLRDNSDVRHSVRQKDESWLQREMRERTDRQRESSDWHRPKQSYEENLSSRRERERERERDDGRGAATRVGHSRSKDELKGKDHKDYYLNKDTGRNSELVKRKERVEDESNSQHRGGSEDVFAHGNQLIHEEKRSRQEKSGAVARSDRAVHASDSPRRVHEKKYKDSRKARESDGGQLNRHREEKIGSLEMAGAKGMMPEQGSVQHHHHHHHAKDHLRGDGSSDDEQQHSSRRGRSKLERWTSHKEKKIDINGKSSSSSSLKMKDPTKDNNSVVSGLVSANNISEEAARKVDMLESNPSSGEGEDAADAKPKEEDRHLDTVAKLKKRSERFKLPMPIEKDAVAIKKMESEVPLPSSSSHSETPANSEVKQERPPRKRRWISS